MTKGIVFYTDSLLTEEIAKPVRDQLLKIGLPITSASLKPLEFGDNYVINEPRGYHAYFTQIITALENCKADIVFFCEHDVFYHPSHFEFIPEKKDTFYYDLNVLRWRYPENFCVTWDAHQVAQLVCYRELALDWYRKKLKEFETSERFNRKFEPEDKFEDFRSKEPSIDIRHGKNLTKSKWSIKDFRDKRTAINFQEGTLPKWIYGTDIFNQS